MNRKLQVFICHYDKRYRENLRYLISHTPNAIEIVGECGEFSKCLDWLDNNFADQVIISIPNDIINRYQILDYMQQSHPRVLFTEFSIDEIDEIIKLYSSVDPIGYKKYLLSRTTVA